MNTTPTTPDRDDLKAMKKLAERCLVLRDRRVVAEAQVEAVGDDQSPLYEARQAVYEALDTKYCSAEERLLDLATRVGAIAPSHIRIDNLIIAVAPWAGVCDGDERVVVVNLDLAINPESAAAHSRPRQA